MTYAALERLQNQCSLPFSCPLDFLDFTDKLLIEKLYGI